MNRWSVCVILAALAVPAAVAAQRGPAKTLQTRSAEVYLTNANETSDVEKRREQLERALGILTEGMENDAGNPLVWMLAGQAYARLGDVAGADSAFDHAESLYPEYSAEIEPERLALWINEYNKGVAAIQAGDAIEAIARFEMADGIYRGRPDAVVLLGSLYAQAGDMGKAEAAYGTAIEISRGPALQKVPEEARADWAEQDETASLRLADLLAQLGRADDAVAVYRGLVKAQPDNPRALSGLAAGLARAGNNEEAASLYETLLLRDDLTDIEWFNAGVGLYSAGGFALAVRAFEKSLEANPYSRDARYNLGQALYGAAVEIEKERAAAPEAEQAAFNARIAPLYEELAEVATGLHELDPFQRNSMMMLAQAQRSLGEMAEGEAAKKEWRDKVLATLQSAEDLPFEVGPVEIRFLPTGVTVAGDFTNLKEPAGKAVVLEFTLIGEGGVEVARETVNVTTPAVNERTSFEFEIETEDVILGWRYRLGS